MHTIMCVYAWSFQAIQGRIMTTAVYFNASASKPPKYPTASTNHMQAPQGSSQDGYLVGFWRANTLSALGTLHESKQSDAPQINKVNKANRVDFNGELAMDISFSQRLGVRATLSYPAPTPFRDISCPDNSSASRWGCNIAICRA